MPRKHRVTPKVLFRFDPFRPFRRARKLILSAALRDSTRKRAVESARRESRGEREGGRERERFFSSKDCACNVHRNGMQNAFDTPSQSRLSRACHSIYIYTHLPDRLDGLLSRVSLRSGMRREGRGGWISAGRICGTGGCIQTLKFSLRYSQQ